MAVDWRVQTEREAGDIVLAAPGVLPPGKLIDIPVSAYYIEHPDGNVLFDTGCHPDWGGPGGRWPEGMGTPPGVPILSMSRARALIRAATRKSAPPGREDACGTPTGRRPGTG